MSASSARDVGVPHLQLVEGWVFGGSGAVARRGGWRLSVGSGGEVEISPGVGLAGTTSVPRAVVEELYRRHDAGRPRESVPAAPDHAYALEVGRRLAVYNPEECRVLAEDVIQGLATLEPLLASADAEPRTEDDGDGPTLAQEARAGVRRVAEICGELTSCTARRRT